MHSYHPLTRLRNLSLLLTMSLSLSLSLLWAPPGLAQDTPSDAVRTTIDTILGILRKPDYNFEADSPAISAEVARAFDATAMAQSVLSTNWRQANPDQQGEFRSLLMKTIENTYIGRLRTYSNESVEIRGEEVRDKRATVDTVIISNTGDIPVIYKLRQRSDGWFVYDVEVENVSMVSSYRETYLNVVKRDGLDGLLEQMRARIAEPDQG